MLKMIKNSNKKNNQVINIKNKKNLAKRNKIIKKKKSKTRDSKSKMMQRKYSLRNTLMYIQNSFKAKLQKTVLVN